MALDRSQRVFSRSKAHHIRLLAPAGCGKTYSLLHRCRELAERYRRPQRFLIVTFTKGAAYELDQRIDRDPQFALLNGRATVSTLNAYGDRRMREVLNDRRLLDRPREISQAMLNQLRPVWRDNEGIATAIQRNRRTAPRDIMRVIDELKSLGFDHMADINFERFRARLQVIGQQGLQVRMTERYDMLAEYGILPQRARKSPGLSVKDARSFYNKFFTLWRDCVASLHEQHTFTFEDQKYWRWLELKALGPGGEPKPYVTGAARYHHILIDEFQDINPLDLALVRAIVERHQASLTIVGDDDQAIFEWRGATPEFILNPDQHFGVEFTTYTLRTNYRSPRNVVKYSQNLIAKNQRRAAKDVRAVPGAARAEIRVVPTSSTADGLRVVSEIVQDPESNGRVAVIGRVRAQLIPYEIYYASGGGATKTAMHLDVFSGFGFQHLMQALEIWERRNRRQRPNQVISDVLELCNRVRRRPFGRPDRTSLSEFLAKSNRRTIAAAVRTLARYNGAELRTRKPAQFYTEAIGCFLAAEDVSAAVTALQENFEGLRYDFEKAEEDVFFAAPPLTQIAEMAAAENMGPDDLIDRLLAAKSRVSHYQLTDDDSRSQNVEETAILHLMTATVAKGKEFDTVILLDVNEQIWPHRLSRTEAELEAERRQFYVAFTRARRRVVFLVADDVPLSPFIDELGLPGYCFPRRLRANRAS